MATGELKPTSGGFPTVPVAPSAHSPSRETDTDVGRRNVVANYRWRLGTPWSRAPLTAGPGHRFGSPGAIASTLPRVTRSGAALASPPLTSAVPATAATTVVYLHPACIIGAALGLLVSSSTKARRKFSRPRARRGEARC